MSAIALNDRDINRMGAEGDVPLWITILGGAFSAIVGGFATRLLATRDRAVADGQTIGEIRTWITEAKLQARDMESRLSTRIASLELHRDNTATKQDLKDAVIDIKEQLRDVVNEVRVNRSQIRVVPPT